MMDGDSGMVLDTEVVHVSETGGNSTAMERGGLSRILKRLKDNNVDIIQLSTDRSATVRCFMKKEYPNIDHQFDVWHFAKSITKKLHKACQKKEFDMLQKWIPSITNHLWWSAATCKGDKTLLL